MKTTRNELISEIIDSARKTLDSLDEGQAVEFNEHTPLSGNRGIFDSIGLVTFIVELEQALEARYNVRVSLADERAMAQEVMPFTNVATLAAYVEQLLLER